MPVADSALASPGPLVLVVDDDPAQRLAVSRMVRGLGYPTRSCRRGSEALQLIRSSVSPVRVLVADLGMPGMDGGELVERAVDFDRRIRAVLMTDPDDPLSTELLAGYRDLPLLPKPVRIADLHAALLALVGPAVQTSTPPSVTAPSSRARRRSSEHHES